LVEVLPSTSLSGKARRKKMVDLALKFLFKYLFEIIAVVCFASALGIVYYKAQHWCNQVCRELKQENEEYRLKVVELNDVIVVAEKRASDLALMWSNSLDRTEKKYADEYKATLELFRNLDNKGKASASRTPTLRITTATNSVLNAATTAANAPNPSVTGSSTEGTTPVPAASEGTDSPDSERMISEADYAASWIEAAGAYASCKLAWSACVTSYESLREASGKISTNVQTE
jgi:hypothetical protein